MLKRFSFLAVGAALSCLLVSAQTITGSITGTITDSSGSVVPSSKVTATNTGTGVVTSTAPSASGVYNLLYLPTGSYTVTVESAGFKKQVLGPFTLEVNQVARVDVSMQVGAISETVEVRDVAPILQTETVATGDTITANKLSTIPLNGRNFATLTLLVPGAISTSPGAMNTVARFQGSGSRPQVNGNREQTNNFLLDGVDVNDSIDNRIGYQPNVDALEEVKVITGNGGGEFGNVAGGSVLLSIKSGSNQMHGSAFEFLRNDQLDANGFINNRGNVPRNALRRNIFGGTFGGPIKKNKLFFFVDYEGTTQRTSGPSSASVAPLFWRQGDVSTIGAVKDPLTGLAFPDNKIPAARFSTFAKNLFAHPELYPLPNNVGTGGFGVTGNYIGATRQKIDNHQGDLKGDWRATDKDSFSARYSYGNYELIGTQAALPVILAGGTYGPTQSAVIDWTRTVSNSLVVDTRVAYSRVGIDDNVLDWSGTLASGNQTLGITGGQPIAGLSSVAIGNGLSNIGSAATIGSTRDNKFQEQVDVSYIKGAHLLKMGGQLLRMDQNRYYAGNNGALGSFSYLGTYSGQAYSDFLLDDLATKGRGSVTGKWGHRQWRNALYVQDTWKVRRDFTLNIGMRWEYNSPIVEVADRQLNIDVFNYKTGTLITPGGDLGRALYHAYYKQFQPTLGFAWTPDMFKNKMVVRGGYRFSSYLEGTGANLRLPLNPPFFVESNITFDSRTPGSIVTGFGDVVGAGNLLGPRTGTGGTTPFYQGRAWDTDLKPQQTNQYNLTVEYQFSSSHFRQRRLCRQPCHPPRGAA